MVPRRSPFADRLDTGGRVLIDGGTGTEVDRQGGAMAPGVWSGVAALTHADVIRSVHEQYIDAGAELILANTYACSRHLLERAGHGEHFEYLNRTGVELALDARRRAGRPEVVVAGSMSTTDMFTGDQPPVDVARRNYADQVAIQLDAGAELIALEMLRHSDQVRAVLDAVCATDAPVWAGVSAVHGADGTPMGVDGNDTLAELVDVIVEYPIEVLSVMHTEVDLVDRCLDIVAERWSGPVGVYAHVGDVGDVAEWRWEFGGLTPAEHTAHNVRWLQRGVQVVGGCCGIGPAHIADLQGVL